MFEAYTLHHVGIICPDLADADDFMAKMGLVESYRGHVERWGCWCIFTVAAAGAVIELVVPDDGSVLAKFNKGAGGVHHFAYQVEDLRATMDWCAARGLRMLEPAPVKGAGDFLCNFINPVDTRGIQIEFVQPLAR
ncbi:VOC family protein [Sphingomonas populi]|uniref:VOC family protein n=1 Tax=Sphingomonas populi TaxID=2484750 RepID=A0A4Q6XW13_9SPHN|nr:VOC family protein [Sphingomonas populi]RZF64131.1 VOC family protein [Sphingomonas populi]